MNTRKILATIIILLSFGLTTSIAHAEVRMFLDFPDSDISGESTFDTHQNEIDVLAWSWTLKVKSTKTVVKSMKFTKYIDSATPSLVMKALLRENLGRAVLTVTTVTEGPGGALDYFVLTLENVTMSSYSTGAEGGEERLVENIALKFDGITGVYTPPAGPGGGGGVPFDWDLVTNELP